MADSLFNVASVKTCTEALGPGRRMAIWFQGCDIGCHGCCNPELQPLEPRHLVSLSELIDVARCSKYENGIEGVTFIGGEPTLQTHLSELARGIRGLGLGVLMFTGRMFEDLEPDLTSSIDTVIDGRFDESDRDMERNLVGSRNQRVIHVTDRYWGSGWFDGPRCEFVEIDVDGNWMFSHGSPF